MGGRRTNALAAGRSFAVLPAILLLGGCPSFTTMGSARTIGDGRSQTWVATGGARLHEAGGSTTGAREATDVPYFELGARYGVTDRVELGGKILSLGLELNAKVALRRTESTDGLNVSVGTAASVYSFSAMGVTARSAWLHLPVLLGFALGGSELVIAPRLSAVTIFGGGPGLFAGGSLGFAWKVTDGFRFLPELSVSWPIISPAKVTGSSESLDLHGQIAVFNLAFLMGGD